MKRRRISELVSDLHSQEILRYAQNDNCEIRENDSSRGIRTQRAYNRDNDGLVSVVTLGERGAVAITNEGEIEFPTREVSVKDIVDSVGSGDIFSFGFAYRLRETANLKEAGRFANELARQSLFYPADGIRIDLPAILSGSLI